MGKISSIGWTGATWNPWQACHKVSPGCKNCYMFTAKKRFGKDPNVVVRSAEATFYAPLKWKEPRLIFTCSWSDWFIEEADAWREEAYDVIRQTPHHTYQILTKRIERADGRWPAPPLPNVWLGVSVENQRYADERIPQLLRLPAAVHFVSYEPALGPVDFTPWLDRIDWIIVGGEGGPDARPFDPDWARAVIAQSSRACSTVFLKQMGDRPIGLKLTAKRGEDPSEWPEDLRVREYPIPQ